MSCIPIDIHMKLIPCKREECPCPDTALYNHGRYARYVCELAYSKDDDTKSYCKELDGIVCLLSNIFFEDIVLEPELLSIGSVVDKNGKRMDLGREYQAKIKKIKKIPYNNLVLVQVFFDDPMIEKFIELFFNVTSDSQPNHSNPDMLENNAIDYTWIV